MNLGAKLGTGGQATVFESSLSWKPSLPSCDTLAESRNATTCVQHHPVAVKAFSGDKAHETASNEQTMLLIVESLSLHRNLVRSYLRYLVFRAQEIT